MLITYWEMNEKLIERKLSELVRTKGGIAIKLYSAYFTGLPDRLILMPGGRTYFVELKTTGKKPTARQKVVHGMLRELGFAVEVIDSQEGIEKFIQAL